MARRASASSACLRSVISRTRPRNSRRSPDTKTPRRTSTGKVVPSLRIWTRSNVTGSPGTICSHCSNSLRSNAGSKSCIVKLNSSSRVYPKLSQARRFTSRMLESESCRKKASAAYSTRRRNRSSLSCRLSSASLSSVMSSTTSIKAVGVPSASNTGKA